MDQDEVDFNLGRCQASAQTLSDALDADVIYFNGDLKYASGKYFIFECRKRKQRRKNAVLFCVTTGGSADAAYRIARYLQRNYSRVYAVITGQCKSAGTLIVSGAHEIYMGDFGEMGPLDVQLSKRDEVWEATSGLNVDEAVRAMENTAEKMFLHYLSRIKGRYRSVTFRTAADVSVQLVEKLLAPIAAQIDPREIGENKRAMDITKNYATRLNEHSGNFKSKEAIDYLVESYPDHGFVIDFAEAGKLFKNVKPLTDEMSAVERALRQLGRDPLDWDDEGIQYEVKFLSRDPGEAANDEPNPVPEPNPAPNVPEPPAAPEGEAAAGGAA